MESLAIVFLFSFRNPDHEQRAAAIIAAACPDLPLSLSSDILPEYREYERTATTVINAYVQPLVAALSAPAGGRVARQPRAHHAVQRRGHRPAPGRRPGGARRVERAGRRRGRSLRPGATGARRIPDPKIITFDMGGTSTDVALCPGRVPATAESVITDLPLRLPVIDIHTVGAGGGSVAYVDAGGGLRVGPRSAGAVPGPACYGRGGQEATVTDANLVLGRLDPGGFLGGRGDVTLDVAAAERVVRDLGDRLGLSLHEAALGVVRIANATMERALRRVSVEQGHDPRRFALLPFGGAGPLHACDLADALGIGRILIPPIPGVLSAYGMLVADIASDASQSLLMAAADAIAAPDAVQTAYDDLRTRVTETLARDGVDAPRLDASLDMRYRGQSYELTVPLMTPITPGTPGRRGVRVPRRTRTTLRLRHARRTGGGGQPPRPRLRRGRTAGPAAPHELQGEDAVCRTVGRQAGLVRGRRARCRPPAMRASDWLPATASTVPRSSSSSIQRSS